MTRRTTIIKAAASRIYSRRAGKTDEAARTYRDLHLRLDAEVKAEKRGKKSA